MKISGDFYGLPTRSLENRWIRLEYLAEAGPRLVRLFVAGSDKNLLAETPESFWETAHGRFNIRGGHRLWHAPETMARTYMPDNDGLTVTEVPGGVRLTGPQEPETGIRKSITVTLRDDAPGLVLNIPCSTTACGRWNWLPGPLPRCVWAERPCCRSRSARWMRMACCPIASLPYGPTPTWPTRACISSTIVCWWGRRFWRSR